MNESRVGGMQTCVFVRLNFCFLNPNNDDEIFFLDVTLSTRVSSHLVEYH